MRAVFHVEGCLTAVCPSRVETRIVGTECQSGDDTCNLSLRGRIFHKRQKLTFQPALFFPCPGGLDTLAGIAWTGDIEHLYGRIMPAVQPPLISLQLAKSQIADRLPDGLNAIEWAATTRSR